MNRLHTRLQEISFELLDVNEFGVPQADELDVKASRWIQKGVKVERHKPRKKGRRMAQLKGTDDRGMFWIDSEKVPPEE